MKNKTQSTEPLLTIPGQYSTDFSLPARATPYEENSFIKDLKFIQTFSSSVGHDFATVLVTFGVILALGSSFFVAYRAMLPGKPSSDRPDPQQTRGEEKTASQEESTTSKSLQNGAAIYIEKAYSSFRQGDVQRAIAELNNGIRVYPQNAFLYTERANFRRRNLGDKQGALEDYTQAINLRPDYALFYLWRSQLYLEIGDQLKAMADYNTAIRLAPEDTMYHFFQSSNVNAARR